MTNGKEMRTTSLLLIFEFMIVDVDKVNDTVNEKYPT